MENKVIKNYLYNLIYQLLIIIIPIITTPYISRVLGADRIGNYNYTNSIVRILFYLVVLVLIYMVSEKLRIINMRKIKEQKFFLNLSLYVLLHLL